MSLSVFSKTMTLVKDHPLGTGNVMLGTSATSLTLSGYIAENYVIIHLTLTGLITLAGIASYVVKILEERKRTKILKNKID